MLRLLSLTLAISTSATAPASAQPVDESQLFAQQHYERGRELYREGRFEDALASFRASYELVPSPNSYLYVARSLRGLERLAEAVEAYERVVRTAQLGADPRYEETMDAARAEAAAIAPSIGRVILRVDALPDGSEVTLDERSVPLEAIGLALPVMPGRVTAVIRAPGRDPVSSSADVAAGAEVELRLAAQAPVVRETPSARVVPPIVDPAPETEASPTYLTLTLASGSLAVLGWGAFAIFGLLADSTFSDLQRECTGGVCDPSRAGDIDAGRTYETIANVGLVTGIAGTALVSLFLLLLVADESPVEPRAAFFPRASF
jgi:hypothetical protein